MADSRSAQIFNSLTTLQNMSLLKSLLKRTLFPISAKVTSLLLCVALNLVCATLDAASVTINLAGRQLDSTHPIIVPVTTEKLPNASSYSVDFQGTCHGTGQLAAFVPAGTSVGQFLNLLSPGASADIEKSYQNNGFPLFFISGVLPANPNPPGLHHLATSLLLYIHSTRQLHFTFSASYFKSAGVPATGSVIFDSGAKLVVTANGSGGVEPVPVFPEGTAGTYSGLLKIGPSSSPTYGFAKITCSKKGTFTAKVQIDGVTNTRKGAFSITGETQDLDFPSGHTLGLSLNLTTFEMDGSFENGVNTATSPTFRKPAYSKSVPFARPGKYTLIINPDTSDNSSPQGSGYAFIKVSSSGAVKVAAKLADGTSFSAAGAMQKSNNLPFYNMLYKRTGCFAGTLGFQSSAATHDIVGDHHWSRPTVLSSNLYPDGFEITHISRGSLFTPPAKGQRLVDSTGFVVTVGEGNTTPFSRSIDVDTFNQVTVNGANTNNFKLTINTSTGMFTGKFTLPGKSTTEAYHGVFLQKQKLGAGFFLGTPQSGEPIESGSVKLD